MKNENITVFYKWQAKPGKIKELTEMYDQVCTDMQTNEPGALIMQYYVDESASELLIHDLFADASALGFHLGVTAAAHFPALLEIATPGPFYFLGDVPEEMKQAALNMGLQAQFSQRIDGFEKTVEAV